MSKYKERKPVSAATPLERFACHQHILKRQTHPENGPEDTYTQRHQDATG